MLRFLQLFFKILQQFIRFKGIVTRDAFDLYFCQPNDIVCRDLAIEFLLVRFQSFVNRLNHLFPRFTFFNVAIDAVFNKYLLQGWEEYLLHQLTFPDLEFLLQQFKGLIRVIFQDIIHRHELRLILNDHAGIWWNGYFAVGKCIQRIHGNLRQLTRLQVNHDLHILRRVVDHLLHFDLPFFAGLNNGFDQWCSGCRKWDLFDHQRLLVDDIDACSYLDLSSAFALVVLFKISNSTRWKVRIDLWILPLQNINRRFDQFVKIMGKNLGRETYRNAFNTLRQQQGKLDR